MPTYEYRCSDCTNSFEIVQKFSEAALTECPECDGQLRKVFSAVGVVFKGSGFYATDNRTKGSSSAAASASSGSGSDAKASAKPAGGSDKGSGSGGSKAPTGTPAATPAA
jgi:putative FmdB family regulatory protein